MDTLFKNSYLENYSYQRDFALALSLLILLLFGQNLNQAPIYAKDLFAYKAVGNSILCNIDSNIEDFYGYNEKKENFDNRIQEKFSTSGITEIDNGIKYIKLVKYFSGRPVRINIVAFNNEIANNYELKPVIASKTLNARSTITNIALKNNSVVAINGGFFKPQTGVPLGTLVIDKKFYTGPIYNRVAMGLSNKGYEVGNVEFNASISGNGHIIKIDNINQPRMLSSYVLIYTSDWGTYAPISPKYGVQLQVKGNKILKASANPLPIPKDGFVIVGPKSKLAYLFGAETIDLNYIIDSKWENMEHIISGGPYLVKNNDIYVDTAIEKLQSISGKNPRTAIGYTKNNDIFLITADGREGSSVGLTLYELASYMKSLGCINAINLDGGGSTVMYVNGQIVNHPQQKGGIALSNAIVISPKYIE